MIIWLEDQKIRHYKIEDRKQLKNITSLDWVQAYKKYLGDLNCPINPNDKVATVDWLLGLAVMFEYSDNSKYTYMYINLNLKMIVNFTFVQRHNHF